MRLGRLREPFPLPNLKGLNWHFTASFMSIQEIEAAITKLNPNELEALSVWLDAYLRRIGGDGGQADEAPFESAYDRIKHLAGSLEGPRDLSTNPKYMEGFGESGSAKRLARRKALTPAARRHWSGEDGLDYQDRIRSEWDDRPTGE